MTTTNEQPAANETKPVERPCVQTMNVYGFPLLLPCAEIGERQMTGSGKHQAPTDCDGATRGCLHHLYLPMQPAPVAPPLGACWDALDAAPVESPVPAAPNATFCNQCGMSFDDCERALVPRGLACCDECRNYSSHNAAAPIPAIPKVEPVMDWGQVRLNGGPPCYAVLPYAPGRYCGRAERWPGHSVDHPFAAAPVPDVPPVDVERELREWWWLGHGCSIASLYGDDGEMQCNARTCRKDFKREPLDKLRAHVMARKEALLADVPPVANTEDEELCPVVVGGEGPNAANSYLGDVAICEKPLPCKDHPDHRPATPASDGEGLRAALEFIEAWSVPDAPDSHNNGELAPYTVLYGSNGERDYMRNVAAMVLRGETPYWIARDASLPALRRSVPPAPDLAGVAEGAATELMRLGVRTSWFRDRSEASARSYLVTWLTSILERSFAGRS